MSHTTRIALVSALLLAPMAARAQQPQQAAPNSNSAPGVAPATEPFPGDALGDGGMWFDDDQLAFGLGDDFSLDSGDLDGGDGDAPVAMDETPGPDGAHHVMARRFQTGPGGMGMGMRRGDMSGRPMFNRRGPMLMRLKLAQLDLSDAQRTKLRDLHEAHARKAIQRRADMQLAHMDLRRLMRADKPDAGAVNAQIDRLARMHAEALKAAFEVRMQARAVLTPDQLKRLHEPMDGMRMHHDRMDAPNGQPIR